MSTLAMGIMCDYPNRRAPWPLGTWKDFPKDRPEDLEYFVTLNWYWENGENLKANVIAANGTPLFPQLLKLSKEDPSASIQQLVESLDIRRKTILEEDCPGLRKIYDEFGLQPYILFESPLKKPRSNDGGITISTHSRKYVVAAWSETVEVRWETNSRHPMHNIIEASLEIVRACEANDDT
jgi:hypothetical protein